MVGARSRPGLWAGRGMATRSSPPRLRGTIAVVLFLGLVQAAAASSSWPLNAASAALGADTLRLQDARAALGAALEAHRAGTGPAAAAVAAAEAASAAWLEDKVWHGTTTCAFVFDHGILVAVDSRASMGEW